MEYRMVMAKPLEFTDAVNEAIGKGWTPQGGIFIKYTGGVDWYYQAMIRE